MSERRTGPGSFDSEREYASEEPVGSSIKRPAGSEDGAEITLDTRLRFWDLQFYDRALEHEYRSSYFDTDLQKTRVGLICAIAVLLIFAIVEPQLLKTPALINQVRLGLVTPLIVACLIATFTIRSYLHPLIVGFSVIATLSQIVLLPILGVETLTNITMAYLQYLLFIAVLLFQPFRYLVLPVILLMVLMTYALRTTAGGSVQAVNYEMAAQGISFIALLFCFLREQSQRQLFAARLQVDMLRNQTERQQANQINWLKNLSRYLEHELRNHVFIVQSNLEFMQKQAGDESQPFVRRALRSAGALSELCDSVGEASTLESALQLDLQRPVNLSRMVEGRVLERSREIEEVNPLELEIEPDLWVRGSEVRLLQVFDHLLNNALEFSSEDAFVRIEVKCVAEQVYLTVHNRGEPLPKGRDIFAAFESSRPKTRLGMGLYVSLKIVEHHSGTIEARTQMGQTIVVVTLPKIEPPLSLVEHDPLPGKQKGSDSRRA